ncbi:hypothetical protein OfM2_18330 [Lactovum odontotermitis]
MSYQHQKKKLSDKSNTHYRTWKKGKSWCYSFSVLAALAGGVVLASQTVNADTSAVTTTDTATEVPELTPATTETPDTDIVTPADDTTAQTSETIPATTTTDETTPAESTEAASETTDTVENAPASTSDPVAPAATTAKLEAPLPAVAQTTYNFTDLVKQGIINVPDITWSAPEGTTFDLNTQGCGVKPINLKFTINPNSVLKPGDILYLGTCRYDGYIGGTNPGYAGVDNVQNYGTLSSYDIVLSDAYNQDRDASLSFGLSTAPSYGLDQTDTTSFTISWLGQTATYNVIPKEYPGDAENIDGFISGSSVDSGTGIVYMQSKSSNMEYDASLFDGSNPNYDASVGGTPSGDYVDIYHIDKATADALLDGANGVRGTGNLASQAAVVSPDGDALAAYSKTNKAPYTSLPNIYGQSSNTLSSFPADSTDEYIVANSQAGTYGMIENSDGTLTVYVNHGSLQEAHPATENQIKGLVFNNDPDGLENATAVYTNPAYSSTTSYTNSGFQLIFADPTVPTLRS